MTCSDSTKYIFFAEWVTTELEEYDYTPEEVDVVKQFIKLLEDSWNVVHNYEGNPVQHIKENVELRRMCQIIAKIPFFQSKLSYYIVTVFNRGT